MKTKLFKILTRVSHHNDDHSRHRCLYSFCQMPKGALLHSHLDGTVNQKVLLQFALEQPAIHVSASQPLTASNIRSTQPIFKALPANQYTQGEAALTNASYVGDSWVDARKARETFDPQLGGPQGFDDWIIGALTINPGEAYKTHNTVPKVSGRCRLLVQY